MQERPQERSAELKGPASSLTGSECAWRDGRLRRKHPCPLLQGEHWLSSSCSCTNTHENAVHNHGWASASLKGRAVKLSERCLPSHQDAVVTHGDWRETWAVALLPHRAHHGSWELRKSLRNSTETTCRCRGQVKKSGPLRWAVLTWICRRSGQPLWVVKTKAHGPWHY